MPDSRKAAYFESKARQSFRLAEACTDKEIARKLRELGLEFAARAVELGADPAQVPRPPGQSKEY